MSDVNNLNSTDDELHITVHAADGGTFDCIVLSTFQSEGRDYIALFPDDDSKQIVIYRYSITVHDGAEGIQISSILSDTEFDAALKVFQSLVIDLDDSVAQQIDNI